MIESYDGFKVKSLFDYAKLRDKIIPVGKYDLLLSVVLKTIMLQKADCGGMLGSGSIFMKVCFGMETQVGILC